MKPRRLGWLVASDSRVWLERDPDTVREPDIAFTSAEKIPLDADIRGYDEVAPDLVAEVTSPSDGPRAVYAKAQMWLRHGVRLVCVVHPDTRTHPLLRGVDLPERLGTLGNSGPLVTKGGLVFLGGGDPYLYAFDKATGAELWRGATPFPTNANPMAYRTESGRQFVVIATGRGRDAALVAFARPDADVERDGAPAVAAEGDIYVERLALVRRPRVRRGAPGVRMRGPSPGRWSTRPRPCAGRRGPVPGPARGGREAGSPRPPG